MKYKLVIFDFDGTLADSYPWFLSHFDEISRRYKLPHLEKEELEKLRTFDIREILIHYRIPFWKLVTIGNYLKKMMSSQIQQVQMVNGMQSVLLALGRQGVKLAVVTSNADQNVRAVLGDPCLTFFQTIESGVSMFGKKSRFQTILKQTGIPASQALSIGDEVRDLKSSHAARLPFGAVNWGYTDMTLLQQHHPEEIFLHPEQILEAVSRD